MGSNSKEGSNYLDGVPIKISSKFIPPRPVPLPYAFECGPKIETLDSLIYDFSFERSVIESHTNRLLQLEEDKNPASVENISSGNGETSCENLNQQDPPSRAKSLPTAQNILPWQADAILLPKPKQIQDPSLEDASQKSHVKINLSDFENDMSSPFDYMELQTINDLEELNSVFQGIHKNNPQEPPPVNNPTDIPVNVSKSKSFPLPSSSSEFNSYSVDRDLERGAYSVSSYELPRAYSTLRQVDNFPGDSCMKFAAEVPCIPSNAGTHAFPVGVVRLPSYLRASKSYSDISSLDKLESVQCDKGRSRTPPSTISYSTGPEETSCKEYISSEAVASSNGNCDNELPDPYNELESDAKSFVDSITEMGFSRPQVARTVKHLGTDEKKVVEHLCQIQTLEESGYEGVEAEAALHLHDYNREEAKMFLDLVSQFQDLGFEKTAVKKALVQNKNDWNKTIDALLT